MGLRECLVAIDLTTGQHQKALDQGTVRAVVSDDKTVTVSADGLVFRLEREP